ncbi:MAG TPA: hypothetical protein VF846_16765 [Thermoanaerobaculia bacterium]|jgi:hypothetical protein
MEKPVNGPPFYITADEEQQLRIAAARLSPSLVIQTATSFDDYVRQLMIPTAVMELARKAAQIRLSTWEAEGIRAFLAPNGGGILRYILEQKAKKDPTHPPYIRVACTGKGDYDDDASRFGYRGPTGDQHAGDYGSPVVLEIWPAQHYSPMHSHGDTTGIVYCLYGQLDIMAYATLAWDAEKVGLLTLTPGQCAWLAGDRFAVHKVYCPTDGGSKPVGLDNLLNDSSNFGASFHVYLNESELPLVRMTGSEPQPHTRDIFNYVDEEPPHEVKEFDTYSDLSWSVLRWLLAEHAAKAGL